jgi:hypothetical protein
MLRVAVLFVLLSSAVAKPYELTQAEIDAEEAKEKAELLELNEPHPELVDPNEETPVPFSESLQTQIYKEGEGCDDSQCGMSCTGLNHGYKMPDDELKEMCGGCTNKPNRCAPKVEPSKDGEQHDATLDSGAPTSVCKCNPMAEDWPIKAENTKAAPSGPAKCEDWCTAPCGEFRIVSFAIFLTDSIWNTMRRIHRRAPD